MTISVKVCKAKERLMSREISFLHLRMEARSAELNLVTRSSSVEPKEVPCMNESSSLVPVELELTMTASVCTATSDANI